VSYKPLAGADDPESEGVDEDNTKSDLRVLELTGLSSRRQRTINMEAAAIGYESLPR